MSRKCKNCSEIIEDESLFCPKCGKYLGKSKNNRQYPVKWIAVAILCVFLIIFFGFVATSGETKLPTSLTMTSASHLQSSDTFSVKLTDDANNTLADKYVTVSINDNKYTLKTDKNGTASINLTLSDGSYTVNSDFKGDGQYGDAHSSDVVVV